MQDLMAKAELWFEGQRRQHLAELVEYRPLLGAAVDCKATMIVGRWESVDKAGAVIRLETRDFLIHTDDLALEPRRGDRIVLANGQQYEVAIPDGGRNPWRWSDRSETLRRIHTQAVATPAVVSTGVFVDGVYVSGVFA